MEARAFVVTHGLNEYLRTQMSDGWNDRKGGAAGVECPDRRETQPSRSPAACGFGRATKLLLQTCRPCYQAVTSTSGAVLG